MQQFASYLEVHALGILFNVTLLIICFLIARLARVKPIPALVLGFLPILFVLAMGVGNGGEALTTVG